MDQRPDRRAPAATSSATPRRAPTPRSTSAPRPVSRRRRSSRSWRPRPPRCRTSRCRTRARCSARSRRTAGASRSTGRSSTTTTPATRRRWTTSAGPATRRPSRARSRGLRSVASTSAWAPSTDEPEFAARSRAVHHVGGEPGPVRRRDGEHAGPPGGVRRCRAAGAVPRRSARAVPHQHRHGRAAAGVGVLGDDRQRHRSTKWHPADSVNPDSTPQTLGVVHREGPPRRSACSEEGEAAEMTTTTPVAAEAVKVERPRVSDRTRAENRLGWKLVAPAVVMMLARHGVPDVPGALPVAVPVPADGARRSGVHRAGQLRHRAHRLTVVAERLEHRLHHGGDRRRSSS